DWTTTSITPKTDASIFSCKVGCSSVSSTVRPGNRPGLQAIAYRVGTHASFVARMLRRLATETVPFATDPTQLRPPPLARLTTRSTNDPAIALLDAWATVA